MRRISCFAMLAVSLVCLTACSFVHPEQRWTTVSQSKEGEPFYKLQVSGKMYQILYNDNGSARKTWHLDNYNPLENLECHTLNEEEIKGLDRATAKRELSGQGSANFTMVYEHYSGSQKEINYYQVGITADKNGQIKPSESSMVLVKTEKVDSK